MKFAPLFLAVAALPSISAPLHAAPAKTAAKPAPAAKPVPAVKSVPAAKPTSAPATKKPAASTTAGLPAGVAADVNGEKILVSDVDKLVGPFMARNAAPDASSPQNLSLARNEILDNLIEMRLLLQEAKRRKITASPGEVDKSLGEIKANFPDAKTFTTWLTKQKSTEADLRKMLGEQLVIEGLFKAVTGGITVSDAEVTTFYNTNKDQFKTPEQVKASHILIKVEDKATAEDKEKARKKALDLIEQLKGGADFATLAKANSDDPGSKEEGGSLGFFGRGQMVKPFEEAAFGATVGQVVGPVESRFGFHIIKTEEKKPEGFMPLDEALKNPKLKAFLARQKSQDAVQQTMTSLKAKAKIVKRTSKA